MTVWDTYPSDYREEDVGAVLNAVRAGECFSVIGLSGAGKSNLMGFLAHRVDWEGRFVLVDGNRLIQPGPGSFFLLAAQALEGTRNPDAPFEALAEGVDRALSKNPAGLSLLLDRFDALDDEHTPTVASNLRALRDAHKYQLTFVTATRRPLDAHTELAELVYANTQWLGPLQESDSRWNVTRYARRKNLAWGEEVADKIIALSWGYPSLLRAVCEAHSLGCRLDLKELKQHPAVVRRVREFWADDPSDEMVRRCGLEGQPLLAVARAPDFDTKQFTAKEKRLFDYLSARPNRVCAKDDLILAVWREDQIYEEGVRDDSLAQLVRRLRVKIEPDPSDPQFIQTVPGRGYLFKLPD